MRAPRRPCRMFAVVAVASAVALSGCTGQADSQEESSGAKLPSQHVHGVAVNPADDDVYLATHDGLFRYAASGPTRVGPVIDLMGFTIAGADHFYASGHPGPGTDLPSPVGLIESRDGGKTWSALSRQGVSDFHTLTTAGAGVIGYDGSLRQSSDGKTWSTLNPPVQPYAVTASPDGSVLIATSPEGPVRSTDRGATWTGISQAPLLQVVDWADADAVFAVTADGRLARSSDRGASWSLQADTVGPAQAIGAHVDADGAVRVLVATDRAVLDSRDGGATFTALT